MDSTDKKPSKRGLWEVVVGKTADAHTCKKQKVKKEKAVRKRITKSEDFYFETGDVILECPGCITGIVYHMKVHDVIVSMSSSYPHNRIKAVVKRNKKAATPSDELPVLVLDESHLDVELLLRFTYASIGRLFGRIDPPEFDDLSMEELVSAVQVARAYGSKVLQNILETLIISNLEAHNDAYCNNSIKSKYDQDIRLISLNDIIQLYRYIQDDEDAQVNYQQVSTLLLEASVWIRADKDYVDEKEEPSVMVDVFDSLEEKHTERAMVRLWGQHFRE